MIEGIACLLCNTKIFKLSTSSVHRVQNEPNGRCGQPQSRTITMSSALNDLAEAGVSVWLDDLSRPLIETGSLAKLVDDGEIVGITTDPTIFAKAIGSGSGYENQLRELALRGTAIGQTLRLVTAWDVRAACDVLRPVSSVLANVTVAF
jgi:hypothetical protein